MKKGFTLIELLIVIAIISILASVVLLSIGGKTDSARGLVKRAEASQLRLIAELYASANGSYEGVCRSTGFINGEGKRIIAQLIDSTPGNIGISSKTKFVGYFATVNGVNKYRAICFDKSLSDITQDDFALYWINTKERFDCIDSDGNIVLNIPVARLGRSVSIQETSNGPNVTRTDVIAGSDTNVLCK